MSEATPCQSASMTGITGLLTRVIRSDQPESTKRVLAILAGCTLCACSGALTSAICWQAVMRSSVDGALVGASIGCNGITAGLAGVAYHKRDINAQTQPGASNQGEQA